MATRLSMSIPTPTMFYALIVGVPVLLVALVPNWRRAANASGRAHPIWAAAILAAIVGVGFATWDGWLSGFVVGVIWFVGSVLLRRAP